MTIIGAGLGLAIPALTQSVTSLVPPADIGTASGAFSTMRQLGGAFGVAVIGAAFASTGSYATPSAFSHGLVTAFGVAAGLAFAGAVAGTILPTLRRRSSLAAPPEPFAPSGAAGTPATAGTPRRL
jgi:MFS family permease